MSRMARMLETIAAASRVAAVASLLIPLAALSQTFPTKPIRMVSALGGGAEVVGRMIAQRLNIAFAQPVLVEAQTGSGGAMGAEMVARASADGYTILLASVSTQVLAVYLSKTIRYDPIKDFTPITKVSDTILCIAAHPSVSANSLKELLDYARQNPGKVFYGTSGIGTGQHLAGEMIKLLTGVNMVHVPYKSGAQVTTDLVGGQIPISFGTLATAIPYAKSGKIKILAVINDKRYRPVADVPTVREIVPGFESPAFWMGYFGPAGIAQPVLKRLHEEIVKAVRAPDIVSKMEEVGFEADTNSPEEFAALIKRDIEVAGKLVKAAGVKPE
jgi:tripartite-type tricarboxylate transporter receptor subunit TctC